MALTVGPKTPTTVEVKAVNKEPIYCCDVPDLHYAAPEATNKTYVSVAF